MYSYGSLFNTLLRYGVALNATSHDKGFLAIEQLGVELHISEESCEGLETTKGRMSQRLTRMEVV